jgi:pimeloyl-ACP methyl ester carboxylesterase
MDQRGVAFSKPFLVCPESARFVARRVGLVYDAASTGHRQVAATRACHRGLVRQVGDLGAYNTTENAAEFADLRTALAIGQWNVYGVSYGTDLALTLMREHPCGRLSRPPGVGSGEAADRMAATSARPSEPLVQFSRKRLSPD